MVQYMRTTDSEGGGGQPMRSLFIRGLYVEWKSGTYAVPMLRFNVSDSLHLGIGRLELICDWFCRSNGLHSGIDD
jgi:hypothetical protein